MRIVADGVDEFGGERIVGRWLRERGFKECEIE
jgi:hypothetical protein